MCRRFCIIWLSLFFISANVSANELLIKINIANAHQADAPLNLLNRLKQDIALSYLKNDQYPAQTDFLFEQAENQLKQSLKSYGYYAPDIQSTLMRDEKLTQAVFKIQLNQVVKWRNIQIDISDEDSAPLIWQNFRQFDLKLKSGNPLRHTDYESTLSDLLNLAANQGYLDARFNQRRFEVNPAKHTADVFIELELGEAYQFGEVNFKGSEQISDDLLKRFIEFEPQSSFEQAKLSELQRSLINSRFFARVQINPQFSAIEQRQIPIEVDLEDNLPHRYKIGAGLGSDTGARFILGFENRLVNQQGHRYEVESILGERAQSFFINYGLPGKRPARQHWNIRSGWEASQSSNLTRSRTLLAPEYNYQLNPNWLIKPYVSIEQEIFRYRQQDNQTTELLLGGLDIQNRYVNDETYPLKGHRHNLGLRVTHKDALSDSEFFQLEFSSKFVMSPIDFWRWILYANFVKTWTPDNQDSQLIPATYRYLLGGENLRGFAFESIGIVDDQGQLQGGKNKLHASIETDYRFTKYLGLALFADGGQVYDQQPDDKYKIGAGAGIRGFTPIGIVRFDIAWPVSETDSSDWHLHFSIGLDL